MVAIKLKTMISHNILLARCVKIKRFGNCIIVHYTSKALFVADTGAEWGSSKSFV